MRSAPGVIQAGGVEVSGLLLGGAKRKPEDAEMRSLPGASSRRAWSRGQASGSRSDEFRELGKGPGSPAQSPIPHPASNAQSPPAERHDRRPLRAALSLVASLLTLAALAPAAQASEAIVPHSFITTASTSLAGAHPNLETSLELESPGEPESAQNVTFDAPQGIFGNTNAITECSQADFAFDQCESDSQAGLITVYANYAGNPRYLLGTAPVYDLVPGPEQTALFSFVVPILNIPIAIPVTVRTTTDYGLRFTVSDISQLTPLARAELTLWGFPAEAGHNNQRFPTGTLGNPPGCAGLTNTACLHAATPSSLPVVPLTDNPTTCTAQPLPTTLEVQTYHDPEHPSEARSSYPPIQGCESEVFKPLLQASPTTNATDSPSGLNLELSAQQFESFAASPSELKSASLTFPPGLTINPDAADGQTMCTNAQANFSSVGPAQCPDNAKIGTISIGSPTLNGPLTGSVYIGQPEPNNQYRLFLIVSGFGMNIKLIGSFKPNPETGQLTAYFEDLPQLPFETFQIHLFAGERALMATPIACTIYAVNAHFFPWDEALPDTHSTKVFGLETGPHGTQCPGEVRPFEPSLEAGTADPAAGAFSSFSLLLSREDGDQYLGHLNFTMPPGLTANLHGVTYCPEASIAAAANTLGLVEREHPSCPATSEIGTSNVAAGPGSHPFHATGKIYLAGPFQGAPLSLVAITPALAGPYDYGTVVVRVALHIDPADAHVIADSEAVPSIIGGIPLRMRSIQVDIDKPNFMINPTNCSPLSVGSEGIGDQGTAVAFSSYFHAVNCFSLPFTPKMSIAQLGGKKFTKRGKNPSLQFDLNTKEGDTNIKAVTVTLPKAFEIDQEHLGNLCDRSELASDHCAGRQPIGEVIDETPLLEQPLKGLAYAVTGFNTGGVLPHVVFLLNGQVMLAPEGISHTVSGGRLQTVVPVVPDAPIGRFKLTLFGGKTGYLANTQSLCSSPIVSTIDIAAQNGKNLTQNVKTKTACKAKKKSKRHKAHRSHRR